MITPTHPWLGLGNGEGGGPAPPPETFPYPQKSNALIWLHTGSGLINFNTNLKVWGSELNSIDAHSYERVSSFPQITVSDADFDGAPSLTMNATPMLIICNRPELVTAKLHMFFVVKIINIEQSGSRIIATKKNPTNDTDASHEWRIGLKAFNTSAANGVLEFGFNTTSGTSYISTPALANGVYLIDVYRDASGNAAIYVNGANAVTGTITDPGMASKAILNDIIIGGSINGSNGSGQLQINMKLAEYLMYNDKLSDADAAEVRTVMMTKYGIEA